MQSKDGALGHSPPNVSMVSRTENGSSSHGKGLALLSVHCSRPLFKSFDPGKNPFYIKGSCLLVYCQKRTLTSRPCKKDHASAKYSEPSLINLRKHENEFIGLILFYFSKKSHFEMYMGKANDK